MKKIIIVIMVIILNIVPVYCYYPGYFDNIYEKQEQAVKEQKGTDADLYDITINNGYSKEVVEQLIADGFMIDYVDELENKGIISVDYKPDFKNRVKIKTEETKTQKTDEYLYQEKYPQDNVWMDESKNIIFASNGIDEPLMIMVNGNQFNFADMGPYQSNKNISVWVFSKNQIYDQLNEPESIFISVVTNKNGNGGIWTSGKYWGDIKIDIAKHVYGIEKTTNLY